MYVALLEQRVGVRREKLLETIFVAAAVIRPVLGADEVVQFACRIAVGHQAVVLGGVAVKTRVKLPGSRATGYLFSENDIDDRAFAAYIETSSRASNYLDAGDNTCLYSLHRRADVVGLAGDAFAVDQDLVAAGTESAFLLLIAAASIVG